MANNTNWLNISSQSGSSGQTILTLSANRNLSTDYKTAEITAYNPVYNVSAKTYVTLEAYSPYIELSPTLIPVADSGGTFELNISANCSWVIAYPDLVSSYSTTAGTGNRTITFRVPSTTADTTLVGNIVVTDESGQVSRTARIEQYGSGAHISLFPVELYFDSTGGSATFSVSADCAYEVSLGSGTDWATVTPNSGYTGQTTFTVTVTGSNTGDTVKTGSVLVTGPGTGGLVALYQRKPETRLIVGYYVTSTTNPTIILNGNALTNVSTAEYPDGTQITPASAYTFPSTGMQYVYYTLTGSSIPFWFLAATGDYSGLSDTVRTVYVPEGITGMTGPFQGDSSLSSITLPSTLAYIGTHSFNGCTSLSSITLPDGLERIGGYVFSGCTSLSSITIPSGVTEIGALCFSGSSVSSITFNSLTPPTLGNANALTSKALSEIIVPCPAVNDYITAWPQYAQYISCSETGTTLYFVTDTSNVKGVGETRTITILNTNINPNRTGLNLPSDFPQQGSYTVVGNTIYLTYPANPSSSATRNWTIGVVAQTNDGVSLSGSYQIAQNANPIYSIPYTADTSTVDASGETRTITIDTSNLVASSITIGVEGATGVTYTYENGVITVVFPNNTGDEKNIIVYVYGETTSGTSATTNIAFEQEAYVVVPINYTGDTSIVSRNGETRTITIDTSNLVVSSISVVGDGSTGITYSYNNGVITVVFPQNYGEEKEFEITVTGLTLNGYDAGCEIIFLQEPYDLENSYLTFNITSDGEFGWFCTSTYVSRLIEYRINKGDWVRLNSRPALDPSARTVSVTNGDVVEFRGDNAAYGGLTQDSRRIYNYFYNTANFKVSGNIMSLVHSVDFATATTLDSAYTFYGLFSYRCSGLTSANSLVLPAVSLKDYCYGVMFEGCTALTTAPELPATNLSGASYCYYSMFSGCTNLRTAPSLPATVMTESCYYGMFQNCASLTTAPSLPANTLAEKCYYNLFAGCTSLTTAPVLSATTLASFCYWGMFSGCTSLTAAPALPATTLADSCYVEMFGGCTSLTTAPVLSATTLAHYCYGSMFAHCTSLTAAPALPATVMAISCYDSMFAGCTSLTTAPVLPASSLAVNCYNWMFSGCTALTFIKCLATDINPPGSPTTHYWTRGVAPTGTFVKDANMNDWTIGESGIPSGWTVQDAT